MPQVPYQLEAHSAPLADELSWRVRVDRDHVLLEVVVVHEGGVALGALPHRFGALCPLASFAYGKINVCYELYLPLDSQLLVYMTTLTTHDMYTIVTYYKIHNLHTHISHAFIFTNCVSFNVIFDFVLARAVGRVEPFAAIRAEHLLLAFLVNLTHVNLGDWRATDYVGS